MNVANDTEMIPSFVDKAAIARLLDKPQELIDGLTRNRHLLAAFGADMSTINDPIPHRVERRGPGRPTDITLTEIYTAIREHLFEERTLPTKRQIAHRIERSEDTLDRRFHEGGTTFERERDELATMIPPCPRN